MRQRSHAEGKISNRVQDFLGSDTRAIGCAASLENGVVCDELVPRQAGSQVSIEWDLTGTRRQKIYPTC